MNPAARLFAIYWQRVGGHKSRGGISLPDCFCIALAEELSAEVVTTDHGEFDRLVPLGIVPIKFIRSLLRLLQSVHNTCARTNSLDNLLLSIG